MPFDHTTSAPTTGVRGINGKFRTDRARLAELQRTWNEHANSAQQARKSDPAPDEKQRRATERAQSTAFALNVDQGNTALGMLAEQVLDLRHRTDTQDAAAAQLYGTALTLQRTSFVLAELMGDDYTQHLSDPSTVTVATLKDLSLVNASLSASTRTMVHAVNVLRQVLIGQQQAANRLNDIIALTSEVSISDAVLTTLAEGTAPRAFANSLNTLLEECLPVVREMQALPTEEEMKDLAELSKCHGTN